MPAAATRPPRAPSDRPVTPPRRTRRHAVGVPIAVALVVLVLAEMGARAVHTHLSTPSAWPSPELQNKYDQIVARASSNRATDVVLVGDSMMDAAGAPDDLVADGANLSIYNASVAGETLPTIAEWTQKVVVPRLHPKEVVIGFSSNELSPASLAPATGIAAYHASRAVRAAEGTGGVIDRADAFLRQHSYLYRYRTALRLPFGQPATGVFDPKLTAQGQDLAFANQQYLQVGSAAQARAVVEGVIAALSGFSVGPQNVALLQGLITSLTSQGIKVMLVVMPVTSDLVSFHPGGAPDYQKALAAFGAIAQRTGAVPASPGIWPTSDFADPVHLNGAGTILFSRYLAPLLVQAMAS